MSTALTTQNQTDAVSWSSPAVDVFEDDSKLVFLADLPGVKHEDVNLTLHQGVLSLEAVTEDHSYRRRFEIDARLDSDDLSAELNHGVLQLTLAKAPEEAPRRIEISAKN